ncbi:hypothetical protein AVEN_245478-1 [Araneus ventricosus]|uniref:Uncharacterized protein n=1 Tax=Araneus ventricosus TaxID=182803 RepID=A0A4Y2D741_ARAVE|nr:hypothetical protein AVEN_245478-1 [Araneus ventricosus]
MLAMDLLKVWTSREDEKWLFLTNGSFSSSTSDDVKYIHLSVKNLPPRQQKIIYNNGQLSRQLSQSRDSKARAFVNLIASLQAFLSSKGADISQSDSPHNCPPSTSPSTEPEPNEPENSLILIGEDSVAHGQPLAIQD